MTEQFMQMPVGQVYNQELNMYFSDLVVRDTDSMAVARRFVDTPFGGEYVGDIYALVDGKEDTNVYEFVATIQYGQFNHFIGQFGNLGFRFTDGLPLDKGKTLDSGEVTVVRQDLIGVWEYKGKNKEELPIRN